MIRKEIQPSKEYNLKEIRDLKLIPWALHYQTLRTIISSDLFKENILKAVRIGENNQIRYSIKGRNIIKYIKKYSPYLESTVRKQKQYDKNSK